MLMSGYISYILKPLTSCRVFKYETNNNYKKTGCSQSVTTECFELKTWTLDRAREPAMMRIPLRMWMRIFMWTFMGISWVFPPLFRCKDEL